MAQRVKGIDGIDNIYLYICKIKMKKYLNIL